MSRNALFFVGRRRLQCFNDFHRFNGRLHIVNAEDVGAPFKRDGVERDGASERVCRRASNEFVNHRLSRDANQYGEVKFAEVAHFVHQLIIVFQRLAETKPWVEDDIFSQIQR